MTLKKNMQCSAHLTSLQKEVNSYSPTFHVNMIPLLLIFLQCFACYAQNTGKMVKSLSAIVDAHEPGKATELVVIFEQQFYSGAPVKVTVDSAFIAGNGGLYALHVHRYGNLTDGCMSIGGHFNPDKVQHGGPNDFVRHAGDLGNIRIPKNKQNFEAIEFYDYRISLFGRNSIIGRSLALHQKKDDFGTGGTKASKLNGNSGPPVICGIVGRLPPEFFEDPPTPAPVAKSADVSVNFGKIAYPVEFGSNGHYRARIIQPGEGYHRGGYGRH